MAERWTVAVSSRIGGGQVGMVLVENDGKVARFATREAAFATIPQEVFDAKELRLRKRPKLEKVGSRIDLIFDNQLESDIAIFWLNGTKRIPYGPIPKKSKYTQSTFQGHVWEVRDDKNTVLGFVTTPATAFSRIGGDRWPAN